ncbi:MAG: oxygen-independent coproporphyrinogen oxidase-like protein [Burkholderiales bacterium]|jgi:oxygen-independent coproporphyrinogen-3 oxidase|nr:oxygen-independent coproporphyrinogen oxidase-like protein [Burkholderiales bacterium]
MQNIEPALLNLTALPPLSLYIHIPWCIKKCPYCDFNSHNKPTYLPENEYIDCLIKDLEDALPLIWGRSIHSIFIGGGTPSLFSPKSVERLLQAVRARTNLLPMAEITIEANPGTVDNDHIKGYSEIGINRISFGIQSFNDKHLKLLGRVHNSHDAVKAITHAQKYFDNINLDIIYALPEQNESDLISDLTIALSFATSHLSFYNLTLEPNTAFYSNPPSGLPDNDLCYAMQDIIVDCLAKHKLQRYEISAYAKPAKQCQHNVNYWQFGDYLGIGAGSHSKLSFSDKIIRQIRQKHPQNYMTAVKNNEHIVEDKVVAVTDLPFEFMLNSLRLIDGFYSTLFVERTGMSLSTILPILDTAKDKGFIKPIRNGQITPTKLGHDFQNELLMLFLKENHENK